MRHVVWLLALLVCAVNAAAQTNLINITESAADFGLNTAPVRRIFLTPIAPAGDYNGTHLLSQPMLPDSFTNGTAVFSNKVSGYAYKVQFDTPFSSSLRTNFFFSTDSGNINGHDRLAWIAGYASDGSVISVAFMTPTNLTATISNQVTIQLVNFTNIGITALTGTNIAQGEISKTNAATMTALAAGTNAAIGATIATNTQTLAALAATNANLVTLLTSGTNAAIGATIATNTQTLAALAAGTNAAIGATIATNAQTLAALAATNANLVTLLTAGTNAAIGATIATNAQTMAALAAGTNAAIGATIATNTQTLAALAATNANLVTLLTAGTNAAIGATIATNAQTLAALAAGTNAAIGATIATNTQARAALVATNANLLTLLTAGTNAAIGATIATNTQTLAALAATNANLVTLLTAGTNAAIGATIATNAILLGQIQAIQNSEVTLTPTNNYDRGTNTVTTNLVAQINASNAVVAANLVTTSNGVLASAATNLLNTFSNTATRVFLPQTNPVLTASATIGTYTWLTNMSDVIGIDGSGIGADGTYRRTSANTWTNISPTWSPWAVSSNGNTTFVLSNTVSIISRSGSPVGTGWSYVPGGASAASMVSYYGITNTTKGTYFRGDVVGTGNGTFDGLVSGATANFTGGVTNNGPLFTYGGGNVVTNNSTNAVLNNLTANGNISASVATNWALTFPFVTLHNNRTATATNPVTGFSTNYNFSSSTTFGLNETLGLFNEASNSPYAGFIIQLEPGLYQFTSQLVVNRTCKIIGAGPASTILRYVGSTNFTTLSQMTNAIVASHGINLAGAGVPNIGLMYLKTNAVPQGGIEGSGSPMVELADFTIQTSTNMYCAGIVASGGDHAIIRNVFSAGPELWTQPSYYNALIDSTVISEPSKMVGFIIGDNAVLMDHCRAIGVANGIIPLGNVLLTIRDFYANAIDYVNQDGATPFPATSELSIQAAVLVPRASSVQSIYIEGINIIDCWNSFYFGNPGQEGYQIINWFDQVNPQFLSYPIGILRQAGNFTIGVDKSPLASSITYTNDASGFYVNPSIISYFTQTAANINGGWQFWNGQASAISITASSFSFGLPVSSSISVQSGSKYFGDGSGLTNLAVTFLTNWPSGIQLTNNSTRNIRVIVPTYATSPATTLGKAGSAGLLQPASGGAYVPVSAGAYVEGGTTSIIQTNYATISFTVPPGWGYCPSSNIDLSGTGYTAGMASAVSGSIWTNQVSIFP